MGDLVLVEESCWIKRKLQTISDIENIDIKNVVDIGSSTLKFRTIKRPFIEKNVYKPLIEKGIKVVHIDNKKEEGVDIVCDISSDRHSIDQKFDIAICTNLLEHVKFLDTTVDNISNMVNDDGYLIITVPYIYPYHPDPIDNMQRFSIENLEALFKNFDIIFAEILNIDKTLSNRFLIGIYSTMRLVRYMKLNYLNNNIKNIIKKPKVTCVLFKKNQNQNQNQIERKKKK